MDCEMIALADENDKIIGYGNEVEVHKSGTLHHGVTLLLMVYDGWKGGQILVHKSSNTWTCSYHTHVKEWELPDDAAYRIVREMLHLDFELWYYGCTTSPSLHKTLSLHKIGIFQYCQKSDLCINNEVNHVFLCMLSNEQIGECLNYMPTVFYLDGDWREQYWDEVAWDEKEQAILWPEYCDLEERMISKPDTFDASSFTVYAMFKYAWNVEHYGYLPGFGKEWYIIKPEKDKELSIREATAFYVGGSIALE